MKTVGYAIVGTGYFGAELGRIMKEQEGAKIVAVLDPDNGQTIADELGCDVETDLDTLYSRDDVDAVIVATPNYFSSFCEIKDRTVHQQQSPHLFLCTDLQYEYNHIT